MNRFQNNAGKVIDRMRMRKNTIKTIRVEQFRSFCVEMQYELNATTSKGRLVFLV